MNRPLAVGLWAVATVVLAAGSSLLVLHWKKSPEPADFHDWMHDHLELTAAQHEALAPEEARFEKQRSELEAQIATAGRDLASAVRAGDGDSPEIRDALQRLNHAQGQLQQTMLDHFFEMKKPLEPEQSEELLKWTHDRLLHP